MSIQIEWKQPISGDIMRKKGFIMGSTTGSKLKIIIPIGLLIWVSSIVTYYLMDPGDVMGHSLIFFWLLLPITDLVVSLFIGMSKGKIRFLTIPVMGIMLMLADYLTLKLSHMLSQKVIDAPNVGYFISGAVISLIGICVGILIRRLRAK